MANGNGNGNGNAKPQKPKTGVSGTDLKNKLQKAADKAAAKKARALAELERAKTDYLLQQMKAEGLPMPLVKVPDIKKPQPGLFSPVIIGAAVVIYFFFIKKKKRSKK